MYFGYSPFHAVSVKLVWDPTTGCVSPQYHVLFDNEFSTVPYIEAGTIPPKWENFVKYSTKTATAQDIDLADTWLQGQSNEGASDPLSYTFYIVTDHRKCQNTNTSGSASANKDIPISVPDGDNSCEASSPTSYPMNQSLANSFAYSQIKSNNVRAGVQKDTYNSNPYSDPSSHDFYTQSLTMPKRLNLHENGLRQCSGLRGSQERE